MRKHPLPISSLAVVLCAILTLVACRLQDMRTKTIQVPQCKNMECQGVIVKVLEQTEGVVTNSIKFGDHTVTVTYDSMRVALKNLEAMIADAGFDANETPANPQARSALPETCR